MTRLILVGGFLGAGKTTLLLAAAEELRHRGQQVGLITNDQAPDLVDTALVRERQLPVEEVAGGCFCCRFPDLMTSIQNLQSAVDPDVIFAEPVGSCTDLLATTIRPLHQLYPGQYSVSPLTVLVDPLRDSAEFPSNVAYLQSKQLAEAEIILLSKSDSISPSLKDERIASLREVYPEASVLAVSAPNGHGVSDWLDLVLTRSSSMTYHLDLDYTLYGEAEAELGWLNAVGNLSSEAEFSPTEWIRTVLNELSQRFAQDSAPIAHVKLHMATGSGSYKASLAHQDHTITWDCPLVEPFVNDATFTINVRVGASPEALKQAVQAGLQAGVTRGIRSNIVQLESFRPSPPQPFYRLTPWND